MWTFLFVILLLGSWGLPVNLKLANGAAQTGTDEQYTDEPTVYDPGPDEPTRLNLSDDGPSQASVIKFEPGPHGELCILSSATDPSRYYDHVDENGLQCQCTLCARGAVVNKHCICNQDALERPQISEHDRCRPVVEGTEMMPWPNKCTAAYNCTICERPWSLKTPCGKYGPDTVCECVAEGLYQPSREECKPEPHCNNGTQPVPGDTGDYTEIQCQPCPEGFFQPNNNSTDMCRPHKQCSREEGTRYSDAVCWNDAVPTTQSAHTCTGSQERPKLQEEVTPAPTLQDILMNTTTPSSVPDLADEMNTTAKPTTETPVITKHGMENVTDAAIPPTYYMSFWSAIAQIGLPSFICGIIFTCLLGPHLKILYNYAMDCCHKGFMKPRGGPTGGGDAGGPSVPVEMDTFLNKGNLVRQRLHSSSSTHSDAE